MVPPLWGLAGLKLTGKCHGGEVYLRQFDGRCIKRLAFTYGNRLDDFRLVMDHMKCTPVKFGDVAYELSIYPGYQIQMILWEGGR